MKTLLIVNPCSGQKKANRQLAEIIQTLNELDHDVLTYITSKSGDSETAVLRLAGDVDRVICCGGDGTFNEVASGVLKSGAAVPIGYIPSGSTNDFAVSLHLNTNLLEAARDAALGEPQPLDMGLFGARYFSYVASFGAFTRTSYTTPQNLKNLLGHTAYILSGIQELFQLKSYPLRFTLEDGTVIEDKFLFGTISNATSVGGILTLDPQQVDMGDGMMELLLIRAPKDIFELNDCVRALHQKTYDCPMISFVSTSRLEVDALEDMPWTLDGEHEPGHPHIEVQCLHHAIRVAQNRQRPSQD